MKTVPQTNGSHLSDQQRAQFRDWLQSRFSERCRKNPRYSLRAFARTLELEASSVSQFLAGKRAPSKKALLRICERLCGTPKDLRRLGLITEDQPNEFFAIAADSFAVLADWHHFAILELTFTKNFRSEPRWIARALDLPVQEVKGAINRMVRLGLLEEKNGKLVKTHASITNHTGFQTSSARKQLQKQIISKALSAVDDIPQEDKDITSITMAIDPKNMDRAREMVKKFRRDLCALLEDGEPSRVYNLAVQLYPVSKEQP